MFLAPVLEEHLHVLCRAVPHFAVPYLGGAVTSHCASSDMRFPLDGGVELHFSATSLGQDQVAAPVRLDHTPDPVQRWDSYDHFRTAAAADLPGTVRHPLTAEWGTLRVRVFTSLEYAYGKRWYRRSQIVIAEVLAGIRHCVCLISWKYSTAVILR